MQNSYKVLEEGQKNQIKMWDALRKNMTEFMFERQDSREQTVTKYKKPIFVVDDMKNCFIDMKKSFEYVGDNSTFQKRITTILVVQWIAFSFMVNGMAFFYRSPTFLCRVPLTDIYMRCPQSLACSFEDSSYVKVIYQSPSMIHTFYQVSITEEFGLICDRVGDAPFAQSLFFLGGFLSGFLFSSFSGKFGRRSNLLIINVIAIIALTMCALARSFSVFLCGYFLSGFALFGYETSVYVYIGEISAIRFRTISINMLTMVWAGTPIFLPVLSLIPTWRYSFLFFALLLLGTLPFAYKCFLQSPRFLVAKQCYGQARQIFEKISITNKRPPYKFRLIEEVESENKTYLRYQEKDMVPNLFLQSVFQKKPKDYGFFDLIRYRSVRKITLVLMYLWMFQFFMYYGLNLALESILKSGLYLTLMISAASLMQVLGSFGITIMTTILYKKYKLDIMKTSILLTTFCCFGMAFVEIDLQCKGKFVSDGSFCFSLLFMVLFVLFVKFFNTVIFSGLINYSSEVYPTSVRSIGYGFTLTFGRLGSIVVPYYVNYMKLQYPTLNSLCFMTPFGLIAFALCCVMPYTEKEGIKEHLDEEEDRNMVQLTNLR